MIAGSVNIWMDVSVDVWWLGECLNGCVGRWVVVG